MSIGANAIAQVAIGGGAVPATPTNGKPPKRRTVTAAADAVLQPEAR